MTAKAVVVRTEHHMSLVNAAWKGAFTTYKPGKRPPRAMPAVAATDAPTSADDSDGASPPVAKGLKILTELKMPKQSPSKKN